MTEKKIQRRHAELITVASDLFASRGIDRVGMEEIAEHASCTRKTLYNHFANKENLVEAILEPALSYIEERQKKLLAAPVGLGEILGLFADTWSLHRSAFRCISLSLPEGMLKTAHSSMIMRFTRLFTECTDAASYRFETPALTAMIAYRNTVCLLESIEHVPDWRSLYLSAMKSLLLVS